MPTYYIFMSAGPGGTPIRHVEATRLPFEDGTTPRFLDAPKGNKPWYKAANLDRPPLGPDQQYGPVVYENLGNPEAVIRYPVVATPPPPPRPKAPPPASGNSVSQLRDDVNAMRQALIDGGLLDE